MTARSITRADIVPLDQYENVRADKRRAVLEAKRHRRLAVGPVMTVLFESYESMWLQIHEMLRVEKGGDAQIPGELEAYNSLIPQGDELVATVLIEIDDETLRHATLSRLGNVESAMAIEVGGHRVSGIPEADVERTDATGKTSSVHFIHFRFTGDQIAAFRIPGGPAVFCVDHPGYDHRAVIPEDMRQALAADFA